MILLSFTAGKIFALLPDYVVPYAIHLLAHDPDLTGTDDVATLSSIREYVHCIF